MSFAWFKSFILGRSKKAEEYGLLATRLVIAAFWLEAVFPRWIALSAGRPVANSVVITLFGPNYALQLTYLFTILETLGGISFISGLAIRLTCVWGIVEFIITGTYGVIIGSLTLSKDLGLLAGSFKLFLSGSHMFSLDGHIVRRNLMRRG